MLNAMCYSKTIVVTGSDDGLELAAAPVRLEQPPIYGGKCVTTLNKGSSMLIGTIGIFMNCISQLFALFQLFWINVIIAFSTLS